MQCLPPLRKNAIMNGKNEAPNQIGAYSIVKRIGLGGMGEVYLAKDPICERDVALKRIKPSLQAKERIKIRFLREAKVTSHLSHPAIVPILSIHESEEDTYYTMPYIQGETLRKICYTTREQERQGKPLHPIGRSIPSLIRIFLQICQAVSYTHAKGVLHRDLKPENIIVGTYGEVTILDWGLANFIDKIEDEKPASAENETTRATRPGKVAGTLAYMAPELLKGKKPSVQTDIYSLGVILYQLLTLRIPFQRKSIQSFRKALHIEELIDPIEMAPHRDIPHQLAKVAQKCLFQEMDQRYASVDEIIEDLKKYIEGRPEWIPISPLDLDKTDDWQLEENVLLAKNIAISKNLDATSWAALKISKRAFSENIKIDATIQLKNGSSGFGFLFGIPEADVRRSLEEGYCLWLGSKTHPNHLLFRSNVQVLESRDAHLTPLEKHQIRIEKIEDQIRVFIDDKLTLSFTSHLPLMGPHVGILYKDDHFRIRNLEISSGSLNAMVNCLAVPNAFLSHRFFDLALLEYRRIAQCFPGRLEGREALFRAGLTLLEKGKAEKDKSLYPLALKEFEKLFKTPGAPLEYLGKSLVYEAMDDAVEEAKCLELALRKFPKHPLLPMLQEHIIYRMHESSLKNRDAAYRIILLALRHIPQLKDSEEIKELIHSLEKGSEKLYFIEEGGSPFEQMIIQLSFWLAKVPALVEIGQKLTQQQELNTSLLGNVLFALLELNAEEEIKQFPLVASVNRAFFPLSQEAPEEWTKQESRVFCYLIKKALKEEAFDELEMAFTKLDKCKMPRDDRILFDSLKVWYYLLQKEPKKAESIFRKYPSTLLTTESSFLHFPFGAWLYITKGQKLAKTHFSSLLDSPYPPTPALPSYFLSKRIDDKKGWIEGAFWWEKKELSRQLDLFYKAIKRA